MAKEVHSRYWPGRRSSAWRKIKPRQMLPCVIMGYTPAADGLQSLLVATVHGGDLRYVAQLRCGWAMAEKMALAGRLCSRHRSRPVVPCPHAAQGVEPEIYCQVRFVRWTAHGRLREAVFAGLLSDAS